MAEFDIGILGGGQLARMSIQAAQRMGLRCITLDPGEDTPAGQIAPCIRAELSDSAQIAELMRRCDHVSLENEFVPASAIVEALELSGAHEDVLVPGLRALEMIQDKLLQRQALNRFRVPSPKAVAIEGDGSEAAKAIGFPMVIKARFGGYDGRGVRFARTPEEFEHHREAWAEGGWLAEEYVPFRRELATQVYISPRQTGAFPTVETVQAEHQCDHVFPADTDASEVAIEAVRALGGIGLYGVELFELVQGQVLVNEVAPRPHNTGHYTLDWGGVSQFEQHVRLVMDLPLIEPAGRETCMANLIGREEPAGDFRDGLRAALQNDAGVRVHWYGKRESRPRRKMGHLNVVGEHCVHRALAARERFYEAWAAR